jgi:hypothetical protein
MKDSLALRLATIPNSVTMSGPTAIGSPDDHINIFFSGSTFATGLSGPFDDSVTIPAQNIVLATEEGDTLYAGFELPAVALVSPQVTIGTIYGTNLTLRWIPSFDIPDVGTIKYSGFGIQHNPGVWLGSKLPVDLSLAYFTQTLKIGDVFEASGTAYGLNVSKTLGWRFLNVTPYGGVMLEKSEMKVAYEREVESDTGPQNIDVDFALKGENTYRATAGLSIRLLAINVNADYNFAKNPSASLGIMVGI